MYIEENGWMLELIFDLSSQALIQMIFLWMILVSWTFSQVQISLE